MAAARTRIDGSPVRRRDLEAKANLCVAAIARLVKRGSRLQHTEYQRLNLDYVLAADNHQST
jgi:hypothetical protein